MTDPNTTATPACPTVDCEKLIKNYDGNSGFIAEMAAMFFDNKEEYILPIRTAIAGVDSLNLKESAHKLKGALGTLCANASFTVAYDLEQLGASGNASQAEPALHRLESELDRLHDALREMIGEHDAWPLLQ